MKNRWRILISLLLICCAAPAQTWEYVGNPGFSESGSFNLSVALDNSNIPYVVYRDGANGSRASVMKFNGSNWSYVGNCGFSDGSISLPKLVIDSRDNPYVAYIDGVAGPRVTVQRFNGSQWHYVGHPGFSAGSAEYNISLALNSGDNPYVAYKDNGTDQRATVMKSGYTCDTVGNPGFSSGVVSDISLALANNYSPCIPYIAYNDYANDGKLTVKVFGCSVWINVGNEGFTAGNAYNPSLALDSSGIVPYVAYQDGANDDKATVMVYKNSNWINVGNAGFSAGAISNPSLALDSSDSPYVAYKDSANNNKATVVKFDGANWVEVGNPGFSAGIADNLSLALDSSNTPYVAYKDGANGDRATVMKFNGVSWIVVGDPGFSAGTAESPSLALGESDIPYVAYQDSANGNRSTVMKFDGANWLVVGNPGFSSGSVADLSLMLGRNNTLYVAYKDGANGDKAAVIKFNGTNWINVGSTGFSAGIAQHISSALDSDDIPYVAYSDSDNGQRATVMKIDTNWVNVGNPGFSPAQVSYTSLALASNDIPYVAYSDSGNDYKVTVAKFNGTNWENVGNPGFSADAAHDLTLVLSSTNTPYIVYKSVQTITVMKFNGVSWENVGDPWIRNAGNGQIPAAYDPWGYDLTMALDSNDIPYVLYKDYDNGEKATVRKFDGANWGYVGSPGFSAGQVNHPSLAIGSNNILYVAYQDSANEGKASVMKWGSEQVDPPQIDVQPVSQTKNPGESVTFTVQASGTAPLYYQWKKGSDPITDATLSSFTISPIEESHQGSYSCTVTNSAGNVDSSVATLTVNDPPQIDVQPVSQTKNPGESVTFTVQASGTAPLYYQWKKGSDPITGATLSSFTISPIEESHQGSYSCTVTNSAGTANSTAATLTVNDYPTVAITSPTSGTVFTAPGNITITAQASDPGRSIVRVEFYQGATLLGSSTTTPYSYTWNGVPVGNYNLTAKAIDDHQLSSSSAPVSVIVNAAPTVAITSPGPNATFLTHATITITTDAADSRRSVSYVEFYQGTTLLGIANSAPYCYTWVDVPTGNYPLTAKACDDHGLVTASLPVAITVVPAKIWLVTELSGCGLQLFKQGAFPPARYTPIRKNMTGSAADGRGQLAGSDDAKWRLPDYLPMQVYSSPPTGKPLPTTISADALTLPVVREIGSGWTHITDIAANALQLFRLDGQAQPQLAASFPGYGTYIYTIEQGIWSKIHDMNPTLSRVDLDGDGSELLLLYFAGYGLYLWQHDPYRQIYAGTVSRMTQVDLDGDGRQEVAFCVPSGQEPGTYIYQESRTGEAQLTRLHSLVATIIAPYRANGKLTLLASYPSFGLWGYDGTTWSNFHPSVPQAVSQVDLDGDGEFELAASFNTVEAQGTYLRQGGVWTRISEHQAAFLGNIDSDADGKDELIAVFHDLGVYRYRANGEWEQLHSDAPSTLSTITTWR